MPQITARDTATGKTVTFNWNGAEQPTDADMADVFKAATSQGQSPPMDARGTFPGMHRDAPRTSIEDPSETTQSVIRNLEGAAHPSSLSDFASLVATPVDATRGVALSLLQPIGKAAAKYGDAAKDIAMSFLPQKARSALSTLSGLNPMEWNSPLTVAGREGRSVAAGHAFNDMPLAQQMERLPNTPTPLSMRGGGPIASGLEATGPFHEQPLYQQMEQLSDVPAGMGGQRSGMPRMSGANESSGLESQVADAARRNKLSPEAQAKLLKQLQLSNLVKIGPETQ